jgi:hypothetical protein
MAPLRGVYTQSFSQTTPLHHEFYPKSLISSSFCYSTRGYCGHTRAWTPEWLWNGCTAICEGQETRPSFDTVIWNAIVTTTQHPNLNLRAYGNLEAVR